MVTKDSKGGKDCCKRKKRAHSGKHILLCGTISDGGSLFSIS